ncbi:MAG: DUF1874 domain-containing protein [Thermoplasmata archaeon]
MKCISNAFSLSMVKTPALIYIRDADNEEVKDNLPELQSFIGHESTAQIISDLLEEPVRANRAPISLNEGDSCYIFQLLQRLPEGKILTKEEIEQLPYKWLKVSVLYSERYK